jgi:hypothetical protein
VNDVTKRALIGTDKVSARACGVDLRAFFVTDVLEEQDLLAGSAHGFSGDPDPFFAELPSRL